MSEAALMRVVAPATSRRAWRALLAATALVVLGPAMAGASPAVHAQRLPPQAEPAANATPSAEFDRVCVSSETIAACNRAALDAIDAARKAEGYGPLVLPRNYNSLSITRQLLAVTNAERTSRGLPAFPASTALNRMAQRGAELGADPTGPSGHTWGSNISWGYSTALAADFGWMYDDGPGSPNVACATDASAGCWGHRRNILAPWRGAAGMATVAGAGGRVFTQLFVDRW